MYYTLSECVLLVKGFALATGLRIDSETLRHYLRGKLRVATVNKNDVALYCHIELTDWLKSAASQEPLKRAAQSSSMIARMG